MDVLSDESLSYFCQSFLNDSQEERPRSIPWKQIATSAPVWAITATHVTQNFGKYISMYSYHFPLNFYLDRLLHPADRVTKLHEECAALGGEGHPDGAALPRHVAGVRRGQHPRGLHHREGLHVQDQHQEDRKHYRYARAGAGPPR